VVDVLLEDEQKTVQNTYYAPAQESTLAPKPAEPAVETPLQPPEDTPEVQPTATPEPTPVVPAKPELVFDAGLAIYSIAQENYVRNAEERDFGNLNALGEDEFYTPVLRVEYSGEDALRWEQLYVTLDDGDKWGWTAGELPSGSSMSLHIYYVNMQRVGEGTHTVRWYIDDEEVYAYTFTLQRDLDWENLVDLPSAEQIDEHNASAELRSPYMSVWLDVPGDERYTEYQIDFKSDHAPRGSYYAVTNFMMDYSSIESQYKNVYTEYGITGYAGFQNLGSGEKICIMSIWDVYCEDKNGNVTTVRAQPTYPQDAYKSGEFGGEGVGAQCLVEYDWQENRWYRAHFICYEGSNGNTQLEFWVTDLLSGEKTLLCAYDLGISGVTFRGDNCIFLENFIPGYSGEVRTMEVRNVKYLGCDDGRWHDVTSGDMYTNGGALSMGYEGSYDYGVSDDRLWIMTTGVGDRCDDSAGKHLRLGE